MATVSTSTSSSSSDSNNHPSGFSYDVFISFRGEDTRKAFTDHLYTALKQAGIRTFRDDDAMDRGRLLKPELEKAIHESQVSLIVFSKGYATSKWCLDEVCLIMEGSSSTNNKRREVVPVFYNIDPTDVRNQTGCFEEAFNGYDHKIRTETDVEKKMELSEKVKVWRSSLKKVGSLTGIVLAEYGYEAEFISNIVKVIRKKVDYNELYIKGKLVGITRHISHIESWLQDPSPNSTILVIDGMGGIGKTTISKCVYNMNCREYDGCSFLANINETSNQFNGMLRLQSQLVSRILKTGKEETIWNQDEGTMKVANAICNKKVLVVLDDVDTSQQLDALLGPQMFYPGSKVIITTRHTSLSTAFKVPPMVQTIITLSNDESVELFSLHAFPQNQPIEPYFLQSEQMSQVTHYCEGLPLALQVLGSNLRGKSIAQWKDAMSKLEKYPLPGIQKVLQLSYDSLEDAHDKDLFLHIACFFVGEDEDFIVKLFGECNLYPIIGIKNLSDRSLLYIDQHGKVGMHQLIREMGQEVVRLESPKDLGKRSRLWQCEDCINVLQENGGTEKVEGLMFDAQNMREEAEKMNKSRKRSFIKMKFKIGALKKMKNLMLLQLNYVTFSGKYDKFPRKYKKLPRKLRLLRWHGFSLESIPFDIPLEKLVVLDMSYSKLKCVWDDYKIIESLKILNLSHSVDLIKTPDFGGLSGLESLIMEGCTSLNEVDESIAELEGLVLLDLTDCRSLRNVPCLPRSLVSLQMSGCPILGVVGRFECSGSTSSPSLLVKLNISNCNLFDNSFPNDWSNLVSLKELRMDGNNVTYLPQCIQSLPRIECLEANECSCMKSILGLPKTLENLKINNNRSLEKLHIPLERQGIWVTSRGCSNLLSTEGWYKWQTIDKVERKVIERLGLGTYLGVNYYSPEQKVLFEYGIFSTWVTKEQIPPFDFFPFKEQISFIILSYIQPHRRISGINLHLVLTPIDTSWLELRIEVYNLTKDLKWTYYPASFYVSEIEEKGVGWLSVWRCGNLLHHGDQIFVRVSDRSTGEVSREVVECCINFIFDDVEEQGEMEEQGNNDDGVVIRWSDRMVDDISDYVHHGNTYGFGQYRYLDHVTGFYSGIYVLI